MKATYYFKHDSNAAHDPKIIQMRSVYGAFGYGLYWMLVEAMRNQANYKLPISGKYALNAYAIDFGVEVDKLQQFINDCVHEFRDEHNSLLQQDDHFLWSEALIRRMEAYDLKSNKARELANRRWNRPETTKLDPDVPLKQATIKQPEPPSLTEKPAAVKTPAALPLDEQFGRMATVYEKNIGIISAIAANELKELAKEYPEEWYNDAMKEAVLHNHTNLNYVKAILRNWKENGRHGKQKTTAAKTPVMAVEE